MTDTRRKYTDEFKAEAVRLLVECKQASKIDPPFYQESITYTSNRRRMRVKCVRRFTVMGGEYSE